MTKRLVVAALALVVVPACAAPSVDDSSNDPVKVDVPESMLGPEATDPLLNPNGVYVESITYGGSGCPQGSVTSTFAPDRTTFSLTFDSFVANAGPGVPATESRKNCQLNLNLHVPMGWQFTVATWDYRGNVNLPAGTTASVKSVYYFQGSIVQASLSGSFVGPVARDFTTRDLSAFESKVWSNCLQTAPLNVNTQLQINSATGPAQTSIGSANGKLTYDIKLLWQRC